MLLGRAGDAEPDCLAVTDLLSRRLQESDQIVVVLSGQRRGTGEHGAPVAVQGRISAVSHFEIELFRAALEASRKPVHVFKLRGFDPGPRLHLLMRILAPALPGLLSREEHSRHEIKTEVRSLLLNRRQTCSLLKMERWLSELYERRNEKSPAPCLFMDGHTEQRTDGPNIKLVEDVLAEQEATQDNECKLDRLWIGVREMMCVDQVSDALPTEYLVLWNRLITAWNGAACWGGMFAHIFGGVFPALNSLTRIRTALRERGGAGLPSGLTADTQGAYASTYYSFAKRMGTRKRFFLKEALRYADLSLQLHGGDRGIYSVRGAILRHLYRLWASSADFRQAVGAAERGGFSDAAVGESLLEYGMSRLWTGHAFQAEKLMLEGLQLMSGANATALTRAHRKLATFYRCTLRPSPARDHKEQAQALAASANLHDQLRQL
jgi:hypothetical protein